MRRDACISVIDMSLIDISHAGRNSNGNDNSPASEEYDVNAILLQ